MKADLARLQPVLEDKAAATADLLVKVGQLTNTYHPHISALVLLFRFMVWAMLEHPVGSQGGLRDIRVTERKASASYHLSKSTIRNKPDAAGLRSYSGVWAWHSTAVLHCHRQHVNVRIAAAVMCLAMCTGQCIAVLPRAGPCHCQCQ
jgi:hypothetical protein